MRKKSISLVLSVLLVIASIASVLTFSVSADTFNLVTDGKFEGTTHDWRLHNNSQDSTAVATIEGDETGGHYLKEIAGLSVFKPVTLEKGVNYTISFDAKFSSADVPSNVDSFYRAGFVKDVGALSGSNFVGPNETSGNKFYNIYPNHGSDKTAWKTHTFTYTPTETAVGNIKYFTIGSYNHEGKADLMIDNVYVCKTSDLVSVTVLADEGGTAAGSTTTFKGDSVHVIASPNSDYAFDGWYNAAQQKVSTEADYTFSADATVELTAKFIKVNTTANLVADGKFEGTTHDWTEYNNSGVTNAVATIEGDAINGHYLKAQAGVSVFKPVTLEAGVEYTISFDAKFSSADVPSDKDSFYRAGFVTNFAALSGSIFVGPYETSGNKYHSIYYYQGTNKTAWKTHTFTYIPTADAAGNIKYFTIGSYNQEGKADLMIDNVYVCKTSDLVSVSATAGDDGTVTGGTTTFKGDSVTVTATPNEGYSFEGWYNGETKVSTDAAYTFTVTEAVTLTAKFKLDESAPVSNYIVNGDFETQPNTGKIYAPSSYDPNNSEHVAAFHNTGVWGRIMSGVTRMDWTESTSAAINGTHYLTSGATADSNQYIRAFGQFVQLPAGDYVLSFIAKSNSSSDFVAGVYSQPSVIGSTAIAKLTLSESETWQQYALNFKIDTAGYYQIAFGENTQGKGDVTFAIDNVVVCKEADFITVTAVTDGGGTVSAPFGKQTIGEQVTVVATPDEYYSFAGWYIGTNLVSADPSYTFTVTGSVELKAEFKLNLDEGSIVKNGNFNINSTLGWIVRKTGSGSGDLTVQVDPDTGSAVAVATNPGYVLFQKVHLEKDVDYVISFDFKFENGESIPSTYTSFYRLAFAKEPTGLSSSNLVGFTGANPYYSIYDNSDATNLSKWKNHSINFKPTEDLDAYLAIGGVNELGGASFSVDNIGIYRKSDASILSVSAVSHGGSGTVTSSKEGFVLPGQTVTVSATPDRGSSFGGWYENGTLVSNELSFTYTVVQSNTLLYARFLNPNALKSKQMLTNNDFSTGDLSGWSIGNTESATSTAKIMTENGDTFVRLSKSDTLYQTVELEPGKTYMVRLTSRIKDIAKVDYDKGFYRFGLSKLEKPNTLQSGSITEAPNYSYSNPYFIDQDIQGTNEEKLAPTTKWREYTYVYSNTSDSTMLVNVVVGIPYCTYPLDVLKLEFFEYGDGVIDFNPTVLYGEDFYDSVQNGNFEGKLSAANWGNTLPKGWQILTGHKETGNRYLSVSGNKSRIYTFPVTAQNTYLVAFSLRTASAGTSTVSIVDKNGNPLGDAYETIPDKAVFSPKANNKWQRMGAYIYCSGDNGDNNIRIKITGGTNQLDIDDITVTKIGYATHETFVGYTGPTTTDYSALKIYNPTAYYSLEDDTVINTADNTVTENGGNGDSDITEDNNYGDNANTGDYSNIQLAVILFAISFVLVAGGFIIALRMKNRRKGGNN